MDKGTNEEEIDTGLPSIRRKYQGGRSGRSNINYGVVLKTTKKEITTKTEEKPIVKEEKIIIKEESFHNRGIASSPIESTSKIVTTEKVVKSTDIGKSQKQIIITETEIKESQKDINKSRNIRKRIEGKGSPISKTAELTTTINKNSSNTNINNNRNGSQGRKIKEEVTTKVITTTNTNQTNQGNRRESAGKKEIIKTVTNTIDQSNNQRNGRRGKQEISTTETTTTLNQRSGSQNKDSNNQKGQITSIKTITMTTTTNERQSRGKSQGQNQKIEITKEINTNQRNSNNSRGRSQDKGYIKEVKTLERQSSRGKSQGPNQKVEISKEVTTNERTSNRGRNQGQKTEIKKEITTNQKQNSRRESQNKKPQVVKEVTSTTSVNKRNSGNKNIVTTTKTVTTANQANKGKKVQSIEERAKSLSISSNNQFGVHENNRNKRNRDGATSPSKSPSKIPEKVEKTEKAQNKIIQVQKTQINETTKVTNQNKKTNITETATNPRNLVSQKSTPIFKANNYNTKTNQVNSKLAIKEKEKEQKPYSTNTEIVKSRHNLSRITINESGKTPKKQYALHVRKLDRIQSNSKMRIIYTNNMEEAGPVQTNFNHNIVVIKNLTVQNFYKNPNISNVARKEINESGKEPIKKVIVNPRLNEIIRSEKKPYKLNYKDFNEKNSYQKSEIKTNLQNKMNNVVEQKNGRNSRNSRDNRNSSSKKNVNSTSNINKAGTMLKTTKTETKMNVGRGKPELTTGKGAQKESKISTSITIKSEANTGNKGGKFNQLQMSRGNRNIIENSGENKNKNSGKIRGGSTNSRGSKEEMVTVERRSSRNKMGGNEATGSKVTTVTKTQVIVSKSGTGSMTNSRSSSITRGKKDSSITTSKTITKTVSKNESGLNGVQGSITRKVRNVRTIRDEKK